MSNTSATGGYLQPAPLAPLPGGLTFQQFIQQVFVGISGLDGTLVRPSWQVNPPKQPDIDTDWFALALVNDTADTFAFSGVDQDGNNLYQRMSQFEIQCSFYGPNSFDLGNLVRDGFQIPQNREALQSAKMDFVSASQLQHVPDLVNERWIDRYSMSVFFRREVLRTYQILTILKAQGTLTGNTEAGSKTVPWQAEEN